MGAKALFIEPGSPWENGYVESLNGKSMHELLNREVFTTLVEAKSTDRELEARLQYSMIP